MTLMLAIDDANSECQKALQPLKAQGKPLEDYLKACHDIGSEPYTMQILFQAITGLKQQVNQQVKCFSCGKKGHVQKNCKTDKNIPNKPTHTNEKTLGLCTWLISVDLNFRKMDPLCQETGRRAPLRDHQTM